VQSSTLLSWRSSISSQSSCSISSSKSIRSWLTTDTDPSLKASLTGSTGYSTWSGAACGTWLAYLTRQSWLSGISRCSCSTCESSFTRKSNLTWRSDITWWTIWARISRTSVWSRLSIRTSLSSRPCITCNSWCSSETGKSSCTSLTWETLWSSWTQLSVCSRQSNVTWLSAPTFRSCETLEASLSLCSSCSSWTRTSGSTRLALWTLWSRRSLLAYITNCSSGPVRPWSTSWASLSWLAWCTVLPRCATASSKAT